MQIRRGSAASYSDVGITALLLSGRARMLDNHNKKQKERKSIMKKRLVALLLILALVICVFSVSAFAYEGASSGASPRGGWTDADGYVFCILGTEYRIPYGTVCSQTYNNTVWKYVYPVQYILTDFAEYHNNPSYDPQGRDGIFGANTASAVRYFQGRRGIQVDGCVGDQTWTAFTQHWVFG